MKQEKRRRDIKSKLIAAICMLLVSSIMMVSTTYAWFTLSTAPEVTGINTSVGANGNLEMALRSTSYALNAIPSNVGNSMDVADVKDANITWGNLVDLDDTSYGLDQITLMPAALNLTSEGNLLLADDEAKSMHLKTPTYGADGRVASLSANTLANIYNGTAFTMPATANYGVRGIGTTSSLTDRQVAYRNYLGNASAATASARAAAKNALEANGAAIAAIAIAYGTGDTHFTEENMTALENIVTALADTTNGPVAQIETALKNYVLAMVVSAANTGEDVAVLTAVDGLKDKTLAQLLEEDLIKTTLGSITTWNTLYTKYQGIVSNITAAQSAITTAKGTPDKADAADGKIYSWSQISGILTYIAKPDAMQVNGKEVDWIKDNQDEFMEILFAANFAINVSVPTGGGFFADVADFAGNYQADVEVSGVSFAGRNLPDIPATMYATSTLTTTYLSGLGTAVNTQGREPAANQTAGTVITDMYGYIVDLAFRTNASNATLQLQTDAIDRIYEDNGTANVETLGGGSSMTFQGANGFGENDVKNLMQAINVVFFDTEDGTVYGIAKLDTTKFKNETDGYTAPLYLMNYTVNTANNENSLVFNGQKTVTEGETTTNDSALVTLAQSQPKGISVLVYLDGYAVDNADVANGATSMTGSLNLQFSTDAVLEPMEYTPLQAVEGDEPDTYTVTKTVADGTNVTINGADSVTAGQDYSFTLTDFDSAAHTMTVTVGGQTATPTESEGTYTITKPTGNIVINIAASAPAG